MKNMNVNQQMKELLDPKKDSIKARLFVTREDGITVYDTIQDKTTTSVAVLVSGVWQASETLMGIMNTSEDVMEFRMGFSTSSQGVYIFPIRVRGKRYFLGAIFKDCLNPGQLKRQVALLKEMIDSFFQSEEENKPEKIPQVKNDVKPKNRDGFLFKDISDEEIDRLFSVGGI